MCDLGNQAEQEFVKLRDGVLITFLAPVIPTVGDATADAHHDNHLTRDSITSSDTASHNEVNGEMIISHPALNGFIALNSIRN